MAQLIITSWRDIPAQVTVPAELEPVGRAPELREPLLEDPQGVRGEARRVKIEVERKERLLIRVRAEGRRGLSLSLSLAPSYVPPLNWYH